MNAVGIVHLQLCVNANQQQHDKRYQKQKQKPLVTQEGILISMGNSGREINIFFLVATWLLNFSKWQPIPKSWSPFLKSNKTFFYVVSVLDRPSKMKLAKRFLISAIQIEESSCPFLYLHMLQSGHQDGAHTTFKLRWHPVTIMMHVLRFGNKLNEKVCRRLIFENLLNSLYLQSPIWRLTFRIWSPK